MVVDKISSNQNNKSNWLSYQLIKLRRLPFVILAGLSQCYCHDYPYDPYQQSSRHITDASGQRADILGDWNPANVEDHDRKNSQYGEGEEQRCGAYGLEVRINPLEIGLTIRRVGASIDSKLAGDEVQNCYYDTHGSEANNSFKSNHLKRLDMVSIEQLLLVSELEPIGEERKDKHQVSHDLKSLKLSTRVLSKPIRSQDQQRV